MKSILVTGGCGFIGSNFIRLLLRNNGSLLAENGYDHLINLDALTYAGNRANLTEFEDVENTLDALWEVVLADGSAL